MSPCRLTLLSSDYTLRSSPSRIYQTAWSHEVASPSHYQATRKFVVNIFLWWVFNPFPFSIEKVKYPCPFGGTLLLSFSESECKYTFRSTWTYRIMLWLSAMYIQPVQRKSFWNTRRMLFLCPISAVGRANPKQLMAATILRTIPFLFICLSVCISLLGAVNWCQIESNQYLGIPSDVVNKGCLMSVIDFVLQLRFPFYSSDIHLEE